MKTHLKKYCKKNFAFWSENNIYILKNGYCTVSHECDKKSVEVASNYGTGKQVWACRECYSKMREPKN